MIEVDCFFDAWELNKFKNSTNKNILSFQEFLLDPLLSNQWQLEAVVKITYKEYFCDIIIDLHVGFENVKMEGGSQQPTVSLPLFAVRYQ